MTEAPNIIVTVIIMLAVYREKHNNIIWEYRKRDIQHDYICRRTDRYCSVLYGMAC